MDSASSCFGGHLRSLDTPNDFRGDLHDLLARSLTADPGRTFPAKGHADMEVNSNQQLYCRLASQRSSTPVSSWRPGPGSGNCQTLPMTAQAEPQRISAGPCSPFQALSQCQYVAYRSCSLPESVAQHRSQTAFPDLCDGLEDVSGLTEPIASSLSCTTPNPYAAMSSSSIDRYPSAPVSPTQSLLAAFASAASADPLPSPSLPPPAAFPSALAVPTEAEHAGSMVTSPHMEVAMSLTVAPAAFSHPIRVNKAFSPAFQVSVSISSQTPITWCVKVAAYLLTAAQVGNLQSWDPKHHSMPDIITGGTAEKAVTCNVLSQDAVSQDAPDGPKSYQGSCCLTFRDMKFASSSGMRPRWLVFAMVLPSGDFMFVHYTAPTIIMSRSCGQCQKAAAILSGQEIAKKKRARSPARHGGSSFEGSLQHTSLTPGLSTEYEFAPTEHTAQLLGQLPQPAPVPGIAHQPGQIPGIMPENLVSQAMFQSPTYTHAQQIPPCPSQLNPVSLAQPSLSHAAPVLTPAEEACLLRLGTQPMSQLSLVSSRQSPAQLPRKLSVQLPQVWGSTPIPSTLPPMSHLSPISSQQLPAQLLGKLPIPMPATRDPRKSLYCSPTVAATSSNPEEGFSSQGGLAYSLQQPQDSECVPPASPAASALFATLLMDSPDVMKSSAFPEDVGNGPTMVSSPALWNSPEPNALSHLSQQRPLSESPISFLDALLSGDCAEAEFALADDEGDFKLNPELGHELSHEDSDCAMLSEAVQMTGQHAQHDKVPPITAAAQELGQAQSLSLTAPSSTFSSQTFPPPEAVSVSCLQEQFPAGKSLHAVSPATDEQRWPQFPPYTICRWQMLVMQLYGDCHFSRKLTSQDIWVLSQRAGFRSQSMLCDTQALCSEQWYSFGKWFISQLHMLQHQQQHWNQSSPLVISGFEVSQAWCEDLLHGYMPGTFLIWHGVSQTACLTVSLVNERESIEHMSLDGQQLAAHPLQVWVMRVHAAKMLVDSKTGQLWKKEQVFSPPPQVDDVCIRQTKRQTLLASDLLRASSCAFSAINPEDPLRELQRWSSFARAASLPGGMGSDIRRRKPRQQHSASRIVTSLSSVTDRHLRDREQGLSQVTGRFSH